MSLLGNPLIKRFAEETGYSVRAITEKIQAGIWQEGVHYVKAPDGKIKILREGVDKWDRGQA